MFKAFVYLVNSVGNKSLSPHPINQHVTFDKIGSLFASLDKTSQVMTVASCTYQPIFAPSSSSCLYSSPSNVMSSWCRDRYVEVASAARLFSLVCTSFQNTRECAFFDLTSWVFSISSSVQSPNSIVRVLWSVVTIKLGQTLVKYLLCSSPYARAMALLWQPCSVL